MRIMPILPAIGYMEDEGIIPRAIRALFKRVDKLKEETKG